MKKILSQIINLNKQLDEKTAIKIREIAATALNDFETYFSAKGFKTTKSENAIKAVYGTKSAFLRHEDFNHNYAGTELPFDLEFKFNKFLMETKRHKIKIEDKDILEDLENIKKQAKHSKILIIANTVNKAIDIYLRLEKEKVFNINLLHSKFIYSDRKNKAVF